MLGKAVGAHQPLMEAGLDSLGATELQATLGTAFGLQLPATTTIDYPTSAALAAHIGLLLGTVHLPAGSGATALPWQPDSSEATCACKLVAVACRYPGSEPNDGQAHFAETLRGEANLPSPAPLQRWDMEKYYAPEAAGGLTMYVRLGAFVPDIDSFDAALFRLSLAEGQAMDPQTRILLEQTWTALADAAAAMPAAPTERTGVYVGCMYQEYTQLQFNLGLKIGPGIATGNGLSYMVGRLSYAFGLTGPSVSTDTACSSSLGLLAGETLMGVAGGVNAMLLPITTCTISGLQALSPDARCKTFDASADGYGRGEGFAVAVLARADAPCALPLALVAGSAINQDGRSSSLTAPNGPSQSSLVTEVLEAAGLAPRAVSGVAVHGTGTQLGDPIERAPPVSQVP
ncbi:hypothetical protein WJX81_005522 [Elliptochloris bilobata]|uniref:Polyketide synthase n=1 Tax=Elliptochloris bilobata TaxID=381761 RepID=A0AAW1S8I0_9CHLO